ncbi:arginase family protein [Actinomadura barringtoniae]|uniref:Arginase family protein n=1 Tax=Actinomadura barringtoniae TaxID=1427535 RepID=A0A939T7K8_9ACTN|nr:arginase family protein [Actinomadura barringtoniae]MBO2449392.1 arginase family protein [Actinomadura barringtoniae]
MPQWQGSGVARARELSKGAGLLAGTVPAGRHLVAEVPDERAPLRNGVEGLETLTAIAASARACLAEAGDDLVVTAGGDCGVELEPVAAASARYGDSLAVVWFDAHGDLNTPEASPSHAFHGMVLRTLVGEGPKELLPARPLRPEQVVLAGGRVLDDSEREFVERSGMRHVLPAQAVDAVAETGATSVYVHIDLDVLDPGAFASLSYPEPDGITPDELLAAVQALTARFTLVGLGITEYQPENEQDQQTLRTLVPQLLGVS